MACSNPGPRVVNHSDTVSTDSLEYMDSDTLSVDTFAGFYSDTIVPPYQYSILREVDGDLNKDGKPEKVVIFNTSIKTELGNQRVLKIYSFTDSHWMEVGSCENCVLASDAAGAMGDPFEEVEIKNGVISIGHFGGARHKWVYHHKYRLADTSWKLIGATVDYFINCETYETADYNVNTGRIVYERGVENCDDENKGPNRKVLIKKRFKQVSSDSLNFEYFRAGENEVILPDSLGSIYF